MKIQVTDGEKYQKVMEMEIPVEEQQAAIKKACKNIAGKVNIPGFRKGKAPRSVLESFVGADAILQEAADDILPNAYTAGLDETGLQPVAQPQVELVQLVPGQPMIFKVTITVKPEVKLGQYKELPVTRRIIAIDEDDVERDLEGKRERMANLADAPEGAEAALTDTVTIDFVGYKDGVPFENGSAEDYQLPLGSNTFIPGFEDQLIGSKAGDEKEIQVTFPEDYMEASLAGQPVTFKVTVKKISNRVLPALDDKDFIETYSETAETIDQLREEIKNNLTEQSKSMADENTRNAAVNAAADQAEMDIPPVMIDQELNRLISEVRQRLAQQGVTLEQYLAQTGGNMEEFTDNYKVQAEKLVRRELTLEAIVKAEDIQLTEEDINNELTIMAGQYYQPTETIREMLAEGGYMDEFMESIKKEKAAQMIYDTAIINDEVLDRAALMKQFAEMNKEEEKEEDSVEIVKLAAEALGTEMEEVPAEEIVESSETEAE